MFYWRIVMVALIVCLKCIYGGIVSQGLAGSAGSAGSAGKWLGYQWAGLVFGWSLAGAWLELGFASLLVDYVDGRECWQCWLDFAEMIL